MSGPVSYTGPTFLVSCTEIQPSIPFDLMFLLLSCFQQKLLLPTLCTSVAIGIAGYFMIWSTPIIQGMGFGYFLAGPMVHYYLYDLRNPNEYYFYYNAGVSKRILYGTTVGLNAGVGSVIVFWS